MKRQKLELSLSHGGRLITIHRPESHRLILQLRISSLCSSIVGFPRLRLPVDDGIEQ